MVFGLRKLNVIRVTKKCLCSLVTNLSVTHFREICNHRFRMTLLTFILVLFWFYLLHSYTLIFITVIIYQSPTHNTQRWNIFFFQNVNICARFVETVIVHWEFVDYTFWYMRCCVVVRASVLDSDVTVEKTGIRTTRATWK